MDMKHACRAAALMKNRRADASGFSARQRVFGAQEALVPGNLDALIGGVPVNHEDMGEEDRAQKM
eukprot:11476100-Alexandrium_andersonii.AAC.1